MKIFKFLTLILSTVSFWGLQAMAPDYGLLRYKKPLLKAKSKSVTPTQTTLATPVSSFTENMFLTDEELGQQKVAHNSDSEFEDDEQESARFLTAYALYKAKLENQENSKPEKEPAKKIETEVKFVLKDTKNSFLMDASDCKDPEVSLLLLKKRNQTASPLSQWLAEGKESLFSETTSRSLSAKKEESDSETETAIIDPTENYGIFFPLE